MKLNRDILISFNELEECVPAKQVMRYQAKWAGQLNMDCCFLMINVGLEGDLVKFFSANKIAEWF